MKWHGVNVMAILRVALLGRFAVSCESRPVDLQASASRLLAYLTLSFGRMVPRSRVAGALWPDLSESRARANLSTVTWRLQTALLTHGRSDTVLGRKSDSLGLDASTCDVDVEIFKRESIGPGVHLHTLDGLARAARARSDIEIVGGGFIATGPDKAAVAKMLDYVRFRIAFYCSTAAYWGVLRPHGLEALGTKLQRYPREGRWSEMAAQIPDEVISLFAVVGTYDTIASDIEARYGGCADTIAFPMSLEAEPRALREVVEAIQRIPSAFAGYASGG